MSDWNSLRNYLVNWIENKKGYIVHFATEGELNIIDSDFNEIVIDERLSYELQTYVLLHECGHILTWENGMFLSLEKKASRHKAATFKERTFTVIEEIEAWKRGLSLAKRLNIPVDVVKWEEEMASAIGKYITWSINPEGYESIDGPKP
jgi:hypothetical protein